VSSLSQKARVAGFLYLASTLAGLVSLAYVPNIIVSANAAATAHNIVAHETLFRLGIFMELLGATLEIFVVLALYRLLNGVDRTLATVMLVLGLIDVPVFFANALNEFGALLFARGGFLSAFSGFQRQAMVTLFLTLHHYGAVVNEIFWGLWLLPFGMLVYKSGFLPRALGIWLILNCFAYLAQNVTGVLFPQYTAVVGNIAFPFQLGEIAIMLWLIIMGANVKRVAPGVAP
jgi:hypothetical protein